MYISLYKDIHEVSGSILVKSQEVFIKYMELRVCVCVCVCVTLSVITIPGHKSRDSSVGIALGYGLDDRGSRARFPAGSGNLFTTAFRPALGPTQPPIQWVSGAFPWW
jgi:hypothetical protein